MCNRCVSPDDAEMERFWSLTPGQAWRARPVYPRALGPFIRRIAAGTDAGAGLVVGQWGLIPSFAKTARLPYATNNARAEELSQKPSYRTPWARGQRCLIPARSFDEPCWETGRNVWWRFTRRDERPFGLAGLWNAWIEPATGEVHESYTMLTVNADDHPLMRRMHKPDPRYGPDEQDKRSVVAIERADAETWLTGTPAQAARLIRAPDADVLAAEALAA